MDKVKEQPRASVSVVAGGNVHQRNVERGWVSLAKKDVAKFNVLASQAGS
jgi:hypothetical protein